jgi:hypothetical protein
VGLHGPHLQARLEHRVTAQLGISITASGPIFGTHGGTVATPAIFRLDGAQEAFDWVIQRSVEELVRLGMIRLFQQGQSKPAGAFLSVQEAKAHGSIPSTGYWRAHLNVSTTHFQGVITNSAVYTSWLEGVQIGELLSIPKTSGLVCAIYPTELGTAALMLSSSLDQIPVMCRLYIPMLYEPTSKREYLLVNGFYATKTVLMADVTLGGLVRNLDFGGEYGQAFGGKLGYTDVGGTICRVADIAFEMTVLLSNTFGYAS